MRNTLLFYVYIDKFKQASFLNMEEVRQIREVQSQQDNEAAAIIGDFEREFHESVRGGQEGEEIAKMEDMQLLQQAWVREKCVNEILPHEEALIGRIVSRVREQLSFLEENAVSLCGYEKDIKLHLVVVECELERVQFLVRAYLRVRLGKLVRRADKMDAVEWARLTSDERVYVEGRKEMVKEVMGQFGGGDKEDVESDDLPTDGHVFIKATRVVVVGEETLQPGEVHVVRWDTVGEAVLNGSVVVV